MTRHAFPYGRSAAARGFSLLELVVRLAIFSILAVTVFSITVETSAFLGDQDSDLQMQIDADRAFQKLAELLRKSGWVTEAGVTYPLVESGGAALEFKILKDLDGNGYAFDSDTGDIEWDPRVFTVKRNTATDVLSVYNGNTRVLDLSRHIVGIDFFTYFEDPSLGLKEIRVSIVARRQTHRGDPISFTRSSSIFLRN
jgi:prepilin-type N-terminal cleavage/methylation domain-containing protein